MVRMVNEGCKFNQSGIQLKGSNLGGALSKTYPDSFIPLT